MVVTVDEEAPSDREAAASAKSGRLGSVLCCQQCWCRDGQIGRLGAQRFVRLFVLAAKKTAKTIGKTNGKTNGKTKTAQTPGVKKRITSTAQEERTVKTLPSNLPPKPKTTALKSSDKDKVKAEDGDKGGGKDEGAGKDSGRPSAARAPGA